MPNLINEIMVRDLDHAFANADGMIFVSLHGLTVRETETLRSSLAEEDVRLVMVRNRLARIAMKNAGYDAPAELLSGNIACCWGDVEDTIFAAKVVNTSPAKKAGKIALRGGLLDGSLLDEKETVALAGLPGRDELRGMMLSAISGPARMLVGVIAAPQSALVRVVQAKLDAAGASEDGAA